MIQNTYVEEKESENPLVRQYIQNISGQCVNYRQSKYFYFNSWHFKYFNFFH